MSRRECWLECWSAGWRRRYSNPTLPATVHTHTHAATALGVPAPAWPQGPYAGEQEHRAETAGADMTARTRVGEEPRQPGLPMTAPAAAAVPVIKSESSSSSSSVGRERDAAAARQVQAPKGQAE